MVPTYDQILILTMNFERYVNKLSTLNSEKLQIHVKVGGYKNFLEKDAAKKLGVGDGYRIILQESYGWIRFGRRIQYISWQGFSIAHVCDQKLIMIGCSDSFSHELNRDPIDF
jgi:hypothetical protein